VEEFRDRARRLRREDTLAEQVAWGFLRNRRTLGLKFRRQVPIDRYIVDFYCHEIRVIVELDGVVHDAEAQMRIDEERDTRLRELGFQILRVPNRVVLRDPESFMEMIRARIPSPGAHL